MAAMTHLLLHTKPLVLLVLVVTCCATAEEGETSRVVTITDENHEQIFYGEWMVEFYATWCPYCKQFTSTWESFADWLSDTPVKVGSVDVNEQPMIAGQFLISQLPTIYHLKDGVIREYVGRDRSLSGLQDFIEKGDWSEMDPIPWYRSPSSYHMKVLGVLFSFSQEAKVIEDYLRKEYNMPTWGIFVTVAGVVIVAGLLAGVMLLIAYEICIRIICKKTPEQSSKSREPRVETSKPVSKSSARSQPEEQTADDSEPVSEASSMQGVRQRKSTKKDEQKDEEQTADVKEEGEEKEEEEEGEEKDK